VFVIGLNVYLFAAIPKGGFPQQDTGQINGGIRADQSISFQAMQGKLRQLVNIIKQDPGCRHGGGLYRRPARWRRLHVHQPEACQPAHRGGAGGDRAPAAASWPG
jgi:Cu/Zn superoxide dismutase